MRWAWVLLLLPLAGCIGEPSTEPEAWSSSQALTAAQPLLAKYPEAKLISIMPAPLDNPWYQERHLERPLWDPDPWDGLAREWLATYLLPPESGYLPPALYVQIRPGHLDWYIGEGWKLFGDDETGAYHHGENDLCFTKTTSDWDRIPDFEPVDSKEVAAMWMADQDLQEFVPGAEASLEASNVRSSYGSNNYWCYDHDPQWRLLVEREPAQFLMVHEPEGPLRARIDWSDGNQSRQEARWSHQFQALPTEAGQEKQFTVRFQVPENTLGLNLWAIGGGAFQSEGGRWTVVDEEGNAVLTDVVNTQFSDPYPAGRTFTATYTYTVGPLGSMDGLIGAPHQASLSVTAWGNEPLR